MGDQIKLSRIGSTGVEIAELGFGGASVGDLFECINEAQAQATLEAAWEAGIRYFDTSPYYGHGKSELRFGHFLRQRSRNDFVLSTKVGRVLRAPHNPGNFKAEFWTGALPFDFDFDYSYDGIMRSYEDSMQRLGLNRIDLLLIHDLDSWHHENKDIFRSHLGQLLSGGWRALEELRGRGCIRGVGAGINLPGIIPRFLDSMDLDFFIVAMPYTLLEQGALDVEFPLCEERGAGVVIGAVFASGILATGPVEGAVYGYKPASEEIMEKTKSIQSVCEKFQVPLTAAAMQFPLAHPVVSAIIPGATQPGFVESNRKMYAYEIPGDFWSELKKEGLIREDSPTP